MSASMHAVHDGFAERSSNRTSRDIGGWFQKKWVSVFRKDKPTTRTTRTNITRKNVRSSFTDSTTHAFDFGIPLNEAGRQDTAESMTAEEFARAVGIQILVASDAEEETETCDTEAAAVSPFEEHGATFSLGDRQRYMDANALTLPNSLKSSNTNNNSLSRKRGPPPLDMSLFQPPTSCSDSRSGPVESCYPSIATSSPLTISSSYESPLYLQRSRSVSVFIPPPTSENIIASRSASVCIPVVPPTSTSSHRVVEVTNKGRFTLTRERSDHFTARRPTHTRSVSSISRFQIVRPTLSSPSEPLLEGPPTPSPTERRASDGDTSKMTAFKSGTLKSIDSGVSV